MKKPLTYAFGIVMLVLLAIVFASESRSQDQDTRWIYRAIWKQRWVCEWGHCYWHRWQERQRYRNHTYHLPERHATRVHSYVYRHDDGENCKALRRVVGDQHLTLDGAKKAANDNWAGAVRFHHGEKYLDLANARGVTYTCSRSSIKEGGVTTLGQTFTRCEIEAIPCRPEKDQER
jgi:hypothetical protein